MRTTLDIDDDILAAAKELARREKLTAGQLVSRLLREMLTRGVDARADEGPRVGGFRPFPGEGRIVSNAAVNAIRDADGV